MHTDNKLINDATAVFLRAGIFVATVIALALAPLADSGQMLPLIAGGALYIALTSGCLLSISRDPSDQNAYTALVSLDVLLISIVIWTMGPQNSLYAMLYYVPILYSAARLDFRSCIASSALAAVSYSFVNLICDALPRNLMPVAAFSFSTLVLAAILGMLYSELFARKQLAESLNASLRRLSAIYDVARAAWDSSYSLEEILQRVITEISDLAGSKDCYIAVLDREGRFQVSAHVGATNDFSWEAALETLKEKSQGNPLLQLAVTQEGDGSGEILTLPMQASRDTVGVVQIHRKEPFRAREIDAVQSLCAEVSVAIENARLRKELLRLATTDTLTGLCNRAEISNRLQAELARALRYGNPVSLLMIDIDGFKTINDRAGHAAGDQALGRLAGILQNKLRDCDSAGRWGGDEFCVLLPETSLDGSLTTAEKLRKSFRCNETNCGTGSERSCKGDGVTCKATLSIGVIISTDGSLSAEQLLAFADRALYAAKRAGRDQVKAFFVGADACPPPPDGQGEARHIPPANEEQAVPVL